MNGKKGYIYILTNKRNGTLYAGVISNIIQRVYQHKNKQIKGFTQRYGINKLVYYEIFDDIKNAIEREKQIKGGNRRTKLRLIESVNPDWKDLYYSIII